MDILELSPQEYHKQRDEKRYREREVLRLKRLTDAREAILRLAPHLLAIEAVYLFGSIMKPGRYRLQSDIDVAIVCEDIATEFRFWRELEQALEWNVDVRPYEPPLVQEISDYGEQVYERENADS